MTGAGLEARLRGRLGRFVLDAEIVAAPGLVTGLSGPSGSGKTTVLRALAGLERLRGRVAVGGEVWQDGRVFLPPHRRGVGLVFQHGALFPHLTVSANLGYGQRRAPPGPIEDAADFARIVTLLRLEPLLGRAPDRLSGGERRRVALGRALLSRPRLLLLDEPLSGLDVEAKAELLPLLRTGLTALDIPVLHVTHDPAEAAALCDRTLLIREGRAPASGVDTAPADP